jgi:hypothetical protein
LESLYETEKVNARIQTGIAQTADGIEAAKGVKHLQLLNLRKTCEVRRRR